MSSSAPEPASGPPRSGELVFEPVGSFEVPSSSSDEIEDAGHARALAVSARHGYFVYARGARAVVVRTCEAAQKAAEWRASETPASARRLDEDSVETCERTANGAAIDVVAMTADERVFATGDRGGLIEFYATKDAHDGKARAEKFGEMTLAAPIRALEWCANGSSFVALACEDLVFVDRVGGEPKRIAGEVSCVSASADGTLVWASGNTVFVGSSDDPLGTPNESISIAPYRGPDDVVELDGIFSQSATSVMFTARSVAEPDDCFFAVLTKEQGSWAFTLVESAFDVDGSLVGMNGPVFNAVTFAPWSLLFVTHRKAWDNQLLTVEVKSGSAPCVLEVEDDRCFATVPMTLDDEENYITGLGLDLTGASEAMLNPQDKSAAPLAKGPMLIFSTTDGRVHMLKCASLNAAQGSSGAQVIQTQATLPADAPPALASAVTVGAAQTEASPASTRAMAFSFKPAEAASTPVFSFKPAEPVKTPEPASAPAFSFKPAEPAKTPTPAAAPSLKSVEKVSSLQSEAFRVKTYLATPPANSAAASGTPKSPVEKGMDLLKKLSIGAIDVSTAEIELKELFLETTPVKSSRKEWSSAMPEKFAPIDTTTSPAVDLHQSPLPTWGKRLMEIKQSREQRSAGMEADGLKTIEDDMASVIAEVGAMLDDVSGVTKELTSQIAGVLPGKVDIEKIERSAASIKATTETLLDGSGTLRSRLNELWAANSADETLRCELESLIAAACEEMDESSSAEDTRELSPALKEVQENMQTDMRNVLEMAADLETAVERLEAAKREANRPKPKTIIRSGLVSSKTDAAKSITAQMNGIMKAISTQAAVIEAQAEKLDALLARVQDQGVERVPIKKSVTFKNDAEPVTKVAAKPEPARALEPMPLKTPVKLTAPDDDDDNNGDVESIIMSRLSSTRITTVKKSVPSPKPKPATPIKSPALAPQPTSAVKLSEPTDDAPTTGFSANFLTNSQQGYAAAQKAVEDDSRMAAPPTLSQAAVVSASPPTKSATSPSFKPAFGFTPVQEAKTEQKPAFGFSAPAEAKPNSSESKAAFSFAPAPSSAAATESKPVDSSKSTAPIMGFSAEFLAKASSGYQKAQAALEDELKGTSSEEKKAEQKFSFGISSSSSAAPSTTASGGVFGAPASTPAGGFSFSISSSSAPAAKNEENDAQVAAAPRASAPAFSFAAKPVEAKPEDSKQTTDPAKGGESRKQATAEEKEASAPIAAPPMSFSADFLAKANAGYSAAQKALEDDLATATPPPGTPPASSTSEGASLAKSFTLSGSESTSPAPKFGIAPVPKPASATETTPSKPVFGFSSSPATTATTSTSTTSSTTGISAGFSSFGFGSAPASSAGSAFGSSSPSSNPAFGATNAATASTPAFGTMSSFGTTATTSAPAFGSPSAFATTSKTAASGLGSDASAQSTFGAAAASSAGFGKSSGFGVSATASAPAFGAPAAFGAASTTSAPAFGAPAAFGAAATTSAPAFGAASAIGAMASTSTPAFGTPSAFGAAASGGSGFAAAASKPSAFGAAAATASPGFGASSAFGAASLTSSPAFGASSGFGAAATGSSGFASAASKPVVFGAAAVTGGGFGQAASGFGASTGGTFGAAATQSSSGFGQAASAFGASTGGAFGAAATQSSSGFGQAARGFGSDQASGGFGQASSGFGQASGGFGQPAGGFGQPAGGFGQRPASGGFGQPASGFGQAPSGFGQQPASGGFGQPASGFGQPASGFGQPQSPSGGFGSSDPAFTQMRR
ncbi:hypothetical protein BE221DRAFT_91362 [Ostreococcus tauri]|uniref:WD40/YVTN repeat-like-containing domain n=1 Tax=Ostreococcus tauri TaxID=70448 RepID=A0A1Y5IH81_OSTTA|nr:hypothetical protein BE221DRAFT_91362 [Ostreococcus tauri]